MLVSTKRHGERMMKASYVSLASYNVLVVGIHKHVVRIILAKEMTIIRLAISCIVISSTYIHDMNANVKRFSDQAPPVW